MHLKKKSSVEQYRTSHNIHKSLPPFASSIKRFKNNMLFKKLLSWVVCRHTQKACTSPPPCPLPVVNRVHTYVSSMNPD